MCDLCLPISVKLLKTVDNMPKAKFQITRKCEVCGTPFLAKTIESKYCSPKCSKKAWKIKKKEEQKRISMDKVVESIPDTRDYISVAEAVAMFGICRDTIYRLIKKGVISSINISERLIRVDKNELLKSYPLQRKLSEKEKPIVKLYNMEPENCYTIGEIAEKFHMDDSTVYLHIRKYSIPTRQIGNYVYVPKSEIDDLYR